MNTKTIAAIVVFAALTLALNLSPIKVPAPYAPFLIYQVWEIPIVAAFLIYGSRVGLLITVLNTLALLALFPGSLPTGPLYNLAAVVSMLAGVGIAKASFTKRTVKNTIFAGSVFTFAGTALRTLAMAIVNYAFLRYPPPIGYGLPDPVVIGYVPLVVIFNITLALYTIPLGYTLAQAMKPIAESMNRRV